MKTLLTFAGWATSVSLLVATGLAADKANYSGKYSVEKQNAASGPDASTLEVVQTQDSLQITRVELGKTTISRCPFDGSEGSYTSSGGVPGKCKAQLKPKYLVLDSVIVARPLPTSPPIRMHSKERWQLSADTKSLTIKSEVDFPDFPADISAVVSSYTPGTIKYTRIVGP